MSVAGHAEQVPPVVHQLVEVAAGLRHGAVVHQDEVAEQQQHGDREQPGNDSVKGMVRAGMLRADAVLTVPP